MSQGRREGECKAEVLESWQEMETQRGPCD